MRLLRRLLGYVLFGPHLNALVNGPLFSLEARGQIGKAIVFAKWKGRDYVRKYVIPANPRTLAQTFQRGILETLSHWWSAIGPSYRSQWTTLANSHNYSTFNAFTKFNLDGEADGDFPVATPSSAGIGASATIDSVVITGGVNKIDLVVTLGSEDVNDQDLLIVTLSTNGGAASTAHTIQRVVHGKTNLTSTGIYELDMLHIPAGSYRVAAAILGGTGETPAWADSSGAVTVTGDA